MYVDGGGGDGDGVIIQPPCRNTAVKSLAESWVPRKARRDGYFSKARTRAAVQHILS